ncbi:hypothetical protein KFK09_013375 [Dendrobium nobile]|uniref:Uncharacterized protein n=1 Tax=Dendrobium nobile TaxID=94219 RepID=A0A8T3B757_DENNO|nr:hypothetical protein KFK09_013375 [Dendrobium nobile]
MSSARNRAGLDRKSVRLAQIFADFRHFLLISAARRYWLSQQIKRIRSSRVSSLDGRFVYTINWYQSYNPRWRREAKGWPPVKNTALKPYGRSTPVWRDKPKLSQQISTVFSVRFGVSYDRLMPVWIGTKSPGQSYRQPYWHRLQDLGLEQI